MGDWIDRNKLMDWLMDEVTAMSATENTAAERREADYILNHVERMEGKNEGK